MEMPSESQPRLKAKMSVMPEAMKKFGCVLTKAEERQLTDELPVAGLADTAAQTNSAGVYLLKKLNFPVEKMIKTSHAIWGAGNSDLDVMGAVLLRLEFRGKVARVIMYICRNEGSTIFSRTTLRQLGLIKEDFVSEPTSCESHVSGCNCPIRASPPPLPTKMPFAGISKNRENLENWLRKRYAESAFTTCPSKRR